MTVELTEFLLARIAEDEAWADARNRIKQHEGHIVEMADTAVVAYIRKECETKQRVMEEHDGSRDTGCVVCYDMGVVGMGPMAWPCTTLRILASAYARHPDYREEWRP